MTERQPPNWLQAGSHPAENDRLFIGGLIAQEGVVSPGALFCTATGGMTIHVDAGGLFVEGTSSPQQGMYHVFNDGGVDIDCGTANGANDRIDTLIAEIQDDAYDGNGFNQWRLRIVAGTPAASPVPPTLPDSSYALYDIDVQSGASDLSAYDSLTDRRTRCEPTSGVSVGTIVDFAGAAAPTGWVLCNGQAVSRDTYSTLFNLIGVLYGPGDGSTTFNIPDFRGRVSVGMGGAAAGRLTPASVLGSASGVENVALTTAQIPSHSHTAGTLSTASAGGHTHTAQALISGSPVALKIGAGVASATYRLISTGAGGNGTFVDFTDAEALSDGAHTHPIQNSTAAAGSGNSHTNMQPYMMVSKIIKV